MAGKAVSSADRQGTGGLTNFLVQPPGFNSPSEPALRCQSLLFHAGGLTVDLPLRNRPFKLARSLSEMSRWPLSVRQRALV